MKNIPTEYKHCFTPAIAYVKETHGRYEKCLKSLDEVYENYNAKLKNDQAKKAKFDGIVNDWSNKVEQSFPKLGEIVELIHTNMVANLQSFNTEQWQETVKDFSDTYHKIRQQIPVSVPAAPKSKDFSSALEQEFGKISLSQKVASKLPGKR